MNLRIALDYSAQHSLIQAARHFVADGDGDPAEFLRMLNVVNHSAPMAPAVDFLIRTGGEKRLSDFLLWECAYAELHFLDCLWPDFTGQEFVSALDEFARRERRFGRVPDSARSARF